MVCLKLYQIGFRVSLSSAFCVKDRRDRDKGEVNCTIVFHQLVFKAAASLGG